MRCLARIDHQEVKQQTGADSLPSQDAREAEQYVQHLSGVRLRSRGLRCARVLAGIAALALPAAAIPDAAGGGAASRQAYGDAWWTGPIVAASAATMPRGHLLIQPYLYDVRSYGSFDREDMLHHASGPHDVHSLTYILYGLSDRFSVGLIPQFGLAAGDPATRRSASAVGDLNLHAHYRLHAFEEGQWLPTTSLVLEEMLPTGRYDRLGTNPGDGLGGGHYTSTLSVYMQRYFWAPNGRIVRTRLDISYSHSSRAHLEDASVYGTAQGFRGFADSGDGFVADLAWEYSATQRWVVALDVNYERDASTRIAGSYPAPVGNGPGRGNIEQSSGPSAAIALAPAIEYNWSGRFGVIAGVKLSVQGRNTAAYAIPVVALNMVF